MKQYGVQRRSPYDLGEDTAQWAGARDIATSWDSSATSANGCSPGQLPKGPGLQGGEGPGGSRVQASGAFSLEHSRGVWGDRLGG